MLLLRVIDFSMWLHPLWEIGLTSRANHSAIIVQSFQQTPASAKEKTVQKEHQWQALLHGLKAIPSVLNMGSNSFLFQNQVCNTSTWQCSFRCSFCTWYIVDTSYMSKMPSDLTWWRLNSQCSAHIVDISELKTDVWRHSIHLESRTYETCKSNIYITNLLLCTRTERAGKAMAASWERYGLWSFQMWKIVDNRAGYFQLMQKKTRLKDSPLHSFFRKQLLWLRPSHMLQPPPSTWDSNLIKEFLALQFNAAATGIRATQWVADIGEDQPNCPWPGCENAHTTTIKMMPIKLALFKQDSSADKPKEQLDQ